MVREALRKHGVAGLKSFTPPKREAGNRVICLPDAAVDTLRDQQEFTRIYPRTAFTFHSREYRERIEQQKTFVLNPGANAVNGRSGAYYSAESSGQRCTGALSRAGLRHRKYIRHVTHSRAGLSAGANPNDITSKMDHVNAQRMCRIQSAWMSENISTSYRSLTRK